MSSSRTRRAGARKPPPKKQQPQRSGLPIPWIVGGVVTVALVLAIVLSFGGGSSDTDVEQYGSPAVTGEPLAEAANPDQEVGSPIPEVSGADFNGTGVSITADGKPKVILFLAHWCGVCQSEVPEVQEWLAEGGLPEGVDMVAVATGTSDTRPNFPPSEWLEREGFTAPVIVDDAAGTVADAYGLTGFPYWVFADAEGRVALRVAGGLAVSDVAAITQTLAG